MNPESSVARFLAILWVAGIAACGSAPDRQGPLTPGEVAALSDSLRATVRDFVAMQGPHLCRDVTPYMSQFDLAGGVMSVLDTAIAIDNEPELRASNTSIFCGISTQSGGVDTIAVQVLSRDAAVTGWTFHEVLVDTAGVSQTIKGAVLNTWVRRDGAWRLGAAKGSHVVVSK